MNFKPRFMATAVSTVPHRDIRRAFELVLENLPECPHFPRCHRLDYHSASVVYAFEGMPGLVFDDERQEVRFSTAGFEEGLTGFYERYLAEDLEYFALSAQAYPGLDLWLDIIRETPSPQWKLLKGHLNGPVTLGLKFNDERPRPIFYDETIRDVIVKTLVMKVKWWERSFHRAAPRLPTLVQIADPQVGMLGSSFAALNREEVIACYNEIFGAARGLTMIHCCANTDWSALLETSVDAVHFDAYEYLENFAIYAEEISRFLERGGMVGWGIVPATDDKIGLENAESLAARLERGIAILAEMGVDRGSLVESSFILPSCAVGNMAPQNAERAYRLTREVSEIMRERYFAEDHMATK